MSFSSAYAAVSNADTSRQRANTLDREENRAEKQQRLTALQNGYTQDEQGNWVPTALQQQKQQTESQQQQILQEQLQATQQAVQAQQAKMNADALANITNYWITKNPADAIKQLHNTPGLKEALQNAQTLDFKDLDIINFNNPDDVDKLVDMGVDREALKDPEVQNALSHSFMKVIGKDGKSRLVPVDSVTKQTNSMQFYTTQQRDLYAENRAKYNSIIKGALPQEVDTQKSKLETQNQILQQQQEDMKAYFEKNPNATYADFQNSQLSNKNNLDMLKEKLDIKSKQLELEGKTKEAAVTNYVSANPKEFFDTLSKSDLNSTVNFGGTPIKIYQAAKAAQGDTKLSSTRRDYLDGMISTVSNIGRLKAKLKDASFNWNAFSKAMSDLAKLTGPELLHMSPKKREALIKRFNFDSDVKTVMAGYIKAMSGAQVSDEERKFYETAIMGGNWSTKEAALASMKGFESGVYNGVKASLESMKYNTPATYLEYKSQLNKVHPEQQQQEEARPKFSQDQVMQGFKKLFPNVDKLTDLTIEQKQKLVNYLKGN